MKQKELGWIILSLNGPLTTAYSEYILLLLDAGTFTCCVFTLSRKRRQATSDPGYESAFVSAKISLRSWRSYEREKTGERLRRSLERQNTKLGKERATLPKAASKAEKNFRMSFSEAWEIPLLAYNGKIISDEELLVFWES